MEPLKVAILGAGAIGSVMGAYLKKAGARVFFINRNKAHMEAVQQHGLELTDQTTGEKEIVHIDDAVTDSSSIGVCDVVIVLVKGPSTDMALAANLSLIGEKTEVMTFQNGLGNAEIIEKYVARERIACGVLYIGASMTAPGKVTASLGVKESGQVNLYVASLTQKAYMPFLEKVVQYLNSLGLVTVRDNDIQTKIWKKLLVNCMVNIPGALLHLSIQECIHNEACRSLMRKAGEEVCAVAAAMGVLIELDSVWNSSIEPMGTVQYEAGIRNYASAAQDAMKKRSTEVDFLNGAVVREGSRLNIPTPFNAALWMLGKAAEETYRFQFGFLSEPPR